MFSQLHGTSFELVVNFVMVRLVRLVSLVHLVIWVGSSKWPATPKTCNGRLPIDHFALFPCVVSHANIVLDPKRPVIGTYVHMTCIART